MSISGDPVGINSDFHRTLFDRVPVTVPGGGVGVAEEEKGGGTPERETLDGPAGSPRPSGLVIGAYLTAHDDMPLVTVADGGSAVRITDPRRAFGRRGSGGKRGKVQGFSKASRRRLMEWTNSIKRDAIGAVFFFTMTLRSDLWGDQPWERIELYRRRWEKRFRRRWGNDGWFLLWRKETHKSGLPHLHALLFVLAGRPVPHLVREMRPWNDAAWAGACDQPEEVTRCRVELMRNAWRGVMSYLTKYLAKPDDGGSTGRQWGVVNREAAPIDLKSDHVPRVVVDRVKRDLVKLQRKRRRRYYRLQLDGNGQIIRARFDSEPLSPRSLDAWQRHGLLRWREPRVYRRVRERPWLEVEHSRPGGRMSKRKLEPAWWEEVSDVAPSLHFVESAEFLRLLEFHWRQYLAELELESLPF